MRARTIDLRIALEAAGASLTVDRGKLIVAEPEHGLPPELRRDLRYHEGALATLVSLYPCACAAGREPFSGVCHPCPLRPGAPAPRSREPYEPYGARHPHRRRTC
jgi:hypothetical protein